jgi:hypothetical protein
VRLIRLSTHRSILRAVPHRQPPRWPDGPPQHQRLTPLEDLPAGPGGLWRAAGLAGRQQSLVLPSDRLHGGLEAGMRQRAVPAAVPPVEHLAGLGLQGLSDLGRAPAALDHGFNVAQQMRPTQLPSPRRIPGGSAPSIGHQSPPELLPKSSWAAATRCASLAAAAPSTVGPLPPSTERPSPTPPLGFRGCRYSPGWEPGSAPTALGRTDARDS